MSTTIKIREYIPSCFGAYGQFDKYCNKTCNHIQECRKDSSNAVSKKKFSDKKFKTCE